MSFLKKLLRRQEPLAPPERPQGLCLHVTLVPRWDTPEDMGNQPLRVFRLLDVVQPGGSARPPRVRG
jgi:hypothetical protein